MSASEFDADDVPGTGHRGQDLAGPADGDRRPEVLGGHAVADERPGQPGHRRVGEVEPVAEVTPRRRPVDQQLTGDGELSRGQARSPAGRSTVPITHPPAGQIDRV